MNRTLNKEKGLALIILIFSILGIFMILGGIYLWKIQCPAGTIRAGNQCGGMGAILNTPLPKALPTPSGLLPMKTQSKELTPEDQSKIQQLISSLATASATEIIPTNWKLYTNNAYVYQIKYPPNWVNHGEQNVSSFHITGTYEDIPVLSSICFGLKDTQAVCELRISVLNGGWDKAKQYFDTIFQSGTKQAINFKGANGIKETGLENYAGIGALVILLEKNNKEYLIQEFTDAEPQIEWQTLDQILASFKFLDQE